MQQVIFFCGADGTGKTHIAQALSKHLNVPYFKASREHDVYRASTGLSTGLITIQEHNDLVDTFELTSDDMFALESLVADPRTLDIFKQGGFSMIFDRGFPCEYAYSQTFNRPFNEKTSKMLDRGWASLGAKIIVCYRSSYDHIIDDVDPNLSGNTLKVIENHYRHFLNSSNCQSMMLNVDDENLEREVNEILAWI